MPPIPSGDATPGAATSSSSGRAGRAAWRRDTFPLIDAAWQRKVTAWKATLEASGFYIYSPRRAAHVRRAQLGGEAPAPLPRKQPAEDLFFRTPRTEPGGSVLVPPAPCEAGCGGQSAGAAPARLCSPGFALQRGANSMRCLPGKLARPLPYQNPLTGLIGTKQQQGLPPPSRAEGSSWPLSGHVFFLPHLGQAPAEPSRGFALQGCRSGQKEPQITEPPSPAPSTDGPSPDRGISIGFLAAASPNSEIGGDLGTASATPSQQGQENSDPRLPWRAARRALPSRKGLGHPLPI